MFENTKAFSGFSVDDIAAAQRFYGEILGLRVSETNGMLTLHIADHRDNDGLNNTKDNLRWLTKPANSWALAVADARRLA